VKSYLYSPWNRIHFIRSVRQIPRHEPADDAHIVVWGSKEPEAIRHLSASQGIPLWRIEDGFLRSVGLGSDLEVPASLVVDKQGIYFDPAQPSDLETILQNHTFTDEELVRARSLRQAIVESGFSKYNVGQTQPLQPGARPGQRVILVPGQVEEDASIRLGCRDIRTNEQLLRAVRKSAPDAWIIYKPHPDILSRNRANATVSDNSEHYQQLITDAGISQCLDGVDEVHTMTSLAGFEGLLRGKRVVTYGMPFYAGWGLTEDRYPIERRSRRLTLDELVTGCLLIYPRYMYISAQFSAPEIILRHMQQRRSEANNKNQIVSSRFSRTGRKLMNLVNGIFYAR
jgi:capsular polysaccharide export protein